MEEEMIEIEEEVKIEEAPKDTSSIRSEPAVSRKDRRGKVKFNKKAIIIVLIIILIVSALIFLLREPNIQIEPLPQSEPVVEETEDVTATPTSGLLNKDDIRIEVLNGTGIAKQASFLEEELGKLGYSDIETGNVDEGEYDATEVTYSTSVDERVRGEIEEKLGQLYKEVKTKESTLKDFDIQIIIGLRKGQVLPTKTPSPLPTNKTTPTPTATTSATPTP